MKRKKDLYKNLLKMENILKAYNEVCSHTKNKRKVRNYKENKCIYISRIYRTQMGQRTISYRASMLLNSELKSKK